MPFLQGEDFEADSKDRLNAILSAFPCGTELVSVTTDSEDDSNRGDTPRNKLKNTEQLDSLLDGDDESDAGVNMLACFSSNSECPVVVDDATTDQQKTLVNSLPESAQIEDNINNNNERNTAEVASSADVITDKDTIRSDDKDSAVALNVGDAKDGLCSESTEPDSPSSEGENNVIVKRTGSFRLIKNNGLLKIVDTSETPVMSEDVKKAKLLKTQSLKGAKDDNDDKPPCEGTEAKEVLQNAVSESKTFKEEFKNVCANIATLERMSMESDINSADSEIEANEDDLGKSSLDSGGVVITVSDTASLEQKPVLELEGVTTNESATDELDGGITENENTQSVYDVDNASSDDKQKQRPKRLQMGNRYSLDQEPSLLSPEDVSRVELTNFADSGSFKVRPLSDSTEAQTSTVEMTTDGGQHGTPTRPPRNIPGNQRLAYSGSFSPGKVTAMGMHYPLHAAMLALWLSCIPPLQITDGSTPHISSAMD